MKVFPKLPEFAIMDTIGFQSYPQKCRKINGFLICGNDGVSFSLYFPIIYYCLLNCYRFLVYIVSIDGKALIILDFLRKRTCQKINNLRRSIKVRYKIHIAGAFGIWENRDRKEMMRGMKKIPTVFEKRFDESGEYLGVGDMVTPGMEWVLDGEGEATEKVDGAACAIIEGVLYRRYDASPKKHRNPPLGSIPCQPAPDPVTGHWPFWVAVREDNRADQWFVRAWANSPWNRADGTYEAVGVHFQGNPYRLDDDFLEKHGRIKLAHFPRTRDGMAAFLAAHEDMEGVVFWKDGEPKCKIRRKDFGFTWPPPAKVGRPRKDD